MGLIMKRLLVAMTAVAVFLPLSSACATVQRVLPLRDTRSIIILHTNDVHGNFRPIKVTRTPSDTPVWVGGSASMATFINGWENSPDRDRILLVDAGDIYQGTPEGNETKGGLAIAVMNRLGYDVMSIGNHEFDFGMENLRNLLAKAEFPTMAENLREKSTDCRPAEVDGPMIIERDGVRIGVFGVITEDLAKVTGLGENGEWRAGGEVQAAETTAIMLRDSGAEMVLMISHCGLSNDSLTAFFLEKIAIEEHGGRYAGRPLVDVIVGGHSHTIIETPVEVGGAVIVQAGSRGTSIGQLKIEWDKWRRKVRKADYKLVSLDVEKYPPNAEMEAFLSPHFSSVDRVMNEVVGNALGYFWKEDRDTETPYYSSPLGNLLADIMRSVTGADIAFQNKGGIRAPLAAGPVRLRDLYSVSPFGNNVVTLTMTGQQILDVIQAVLTESKLGGGYTPLEISGITVYYDPARPSGDRLVNTLVGPRALARNAEYRIATNAFLADGGDGYPQFKGAKTVVDSGRTLLSVEIDYFKSMTDGVAPDGENRWKAVYEP